MTTIEELLNKSKEEIEAEIGKLKADLERTRMGIEKASTIEEYLTLSKQVSGNTAELAARLEKLHTML